jgi:uncharacterized protein YecT (DUF1311 family)
MMKLGFRRFLAFGTGMVLSYSLPARAQTCDANNVSPQCVERRSEQGYEQVDGELNQTYRQIIQGLSKPEGEYIDYPTLKSRFVEAQRQWVKFRDAECSAWFLINEAGTGRDEDELNCRIQRTQDRIRELKEWVKALP